MTRGKTIGRGVSLLAALMLFCTGLLAQQVEFVAAGPQMVETGSAFRVEFTMTTHSRDVHPTNFTPPDFAGVNVIAGPTESRGQSISVINGRRSESYTFTYTYILSVPEEGQVAIPAASATAGGKGYSTRPFQIEAVSGAARQQHPQAQGGRAGQPSTTIESDEMLVRIVPSRTTVYKGEPIRVSLKVYTRVDMAIRDVKYPAFNGFWSQEIRIDDPWKQETYNNKLYNARIIREFLLFPQQSGTLSIEQFSMSVIAQIVTQNRRQSSFDDFFGGGPMVQEIPKDLTAGPVPITVRDWPAGAPAGFQGAVGQFKLEGGPNQTDIAANSAANFDVRISGTGNLPLIDAPKIEMPTSFEQYTIKTTDSYNAGGANISGSKSFSIPFIARAEGEYTIPPAEFVYFDPSAERYVTLRTPYHTLHIGQDAGGGSASSSGLVSGTSKEELRILGEDIRFIRISDPKLRKIGSVFLFSGGYWLALLLILGLFVLSLVYLQKRIRVRSDKTLVRNKRAQKVALRRLKTAEKHMLARDHAGFYDEMMKALWGYTGDKLNIPVANLSRDNVKEGLAAKGVEPELVDRYIAAIAECEYMRYAPSDKTQIGDVYNSAVELISKMESKI